VGTGAPVVLDLEAAEQVGGVRAVPGSIESFRRRLAVLLVALTAIGVGALAGEVAFGGGVGRAPVRRAPSSFARLEALPMQAQAAISDTLGATAPRDAAVRVAGGAWRLSGGGLSTSISGGGALIKAAGGGSVSFGPASRGATGIAATANRVTYGGADVKAWYESGPLGLEQGFVVARRPARERGPLTVTMTVGGSLRARMHGGGLVFANADGRAVLRYGGLIAVDASGRRLPAAMRIRGRSLILGVADRGARYPIRIDPFVENVKLAGDGAGSGDFGDSVALSADGSTALVGEPGASSDDGEAWVFTNVNGVWSQPGTELTGVCTSDCGNTPEGDTSGGQFGTSVSLSTDGETALVGAPDDNGGAGAAWVFTLSNGSWSNQAVLDGDCTTVCTHEGQGETGNGEFGDAVALSQDGNTAIIGAPADDSNVGGAWVFEQSGGAWTSQDGELVGSCSDTCVGYGVSVAVSDETTGPGASATALVGSTQDNSQAGGVWVYEYSFGQGGDAWRQVNQLVGGCEGNGNICAHEGQGENGAGEFGASVATTPDATTILVGAPADTSDAGAAWAFSNSEGTLTDGTRLVGDCTSSCSDQGTGETNPGEFGSSVSLSTDGTTALIGGERDNGQIGGAWVFGSSGGTWTQQGSELTADDEVQEADFGHTVSLSGDGTEALIGGPDDGGDSQIGAAWVFGSKPVNTSLPVIENSPAVGSPLACTNGTWTPSSGLTYTYRWNRDGSAISGATSSSYTVTSADEARTLTCTVTASDEGGPTSATSGGVLVPLLSATVAFTINPYNDPTLSGKQLTFKVTSPINGAKYVWNFGDGHTAIGATVDHTYAAPGLISSSDANHLRCPTGERRCPVANTREAVYAVTATLVVGDSPAAAGSKDIVVVPVHPPTANFQLLRTSPPGSIGASTAVTDPVTIVPEAQLPDTYSTSQDQIVKQAFWLGGNTDRPPDVICLANGTCTHAAGETDIGGAPVTSNGTPMSASVGAACRHSHKARTSQACVTYLPTAGYESFSINFWNAALSQIGTSASGFASTPAIRAQPQREVPPPDPGGISSTPLTVGYPPLSNRLLDDADGYNGEQGIPYGACMPGYILLTTPVAAWKPAFPGTYGVCANVSYLNSEPLLTEGSQGSTAIFGPYDLSHHGVNSTQQLEDQWNFLYNYSTVVGVDTTLDAQCGQATGESGCKPNHNPKPRTITSIAYDSEGVPSAPVTQKLPLTQAASPSLSVCVEDVTGHTPCITAAQAGHPQPFTINTGDTLRFEVTGHSGGTSPISYYAIAVGQPNTGTVLVNGGAKHGGATLSDCDAPDSIGSWGEVGDNAPGSVTVTTPNGTGPGSPPGGSTDTKKTPASGPKAAADEERAHASTTPDAVPPFSDLEAGAFPAHNCDGYALRTVNAAAPPGPAPTSGPNQSLHPAVAVRATASHAAPNTANPILITSNADALDFTLPKTGTYSTSLAAYSEAGLGAVERFDGFLAQPAVKGGRCITVQSQNITIPVPNSKHHGSVKLAFSGNCVTVVRYHTSDELFASTEPIDVSGIPLAPQPGDAIVIDPHSSPNGFYVAPCDLTDADLSKQDVTHLCPEGSGGKLYLALGTGDDDAPGIADVANFTTTTADQWFYPLTSGSIPKVGQVPKGYKPLKGCGLYAYSNAWPITPGGQYDGFKIVTPPCVAMSRNGDSRVAFWDQLPQAFTNGASTTPETSQVVLYGKDVPAVTDLDSHQYANVARARHPKPQIAGDFPHARRPHGDEDPGFPDIPDCPPSTNGRSGLSIPQDSDMGPISLPVGASFCYIASTGDFIGNVSVNIPAPTPINGVEVGFEIGHGRLIDAGGDVSGNIPVFPAVFINDFKFDIQTDPTQVAAEITASIADLLDVEGGLIINSSTPEVAFTGSVSIADGAITFGDFSVVFTHQGVGMHVGINENYGPVSLDVNVKGGLGTSPPAFYLEGDGSACLFICLDVQGLVSNLGIAACGSINLLFTTFSGGFAVMWSGANSGVHLFTGCNLEPFIPPSLVNVQTSPDRASPDIRRESSQSGQVPLEPGASASIPLCPSTAPSTCSTSVVAVQFHSLVGKEAVGATPEVSLVGPDGRVVTTPTQAGYYGFEGSAQPSGGASGGQTEEGTSLVDQNAVPVDDTVSNSGAYCAPAADDQTIRGLPSNCLKVTTTSMYIAKPGTGDWKLEVDPTSPAVEDVSVAPEMAPVSPSQFNPTVDDVGISGTAHSFELHIAGKTYSSSLLADRHRLLLAPSVLLSPTRTGAEVAAVPVVRASELDVPTIDASRLRALVLKMPPSFSGTASILDQGSGGASQVVASGITSDDIPRGGLPTVFQPLPDAGSKQTIVAFLTNSEGMPSRELTLATFTSPPVAAPRAPKIVKDVRDGSTVKVYFDPGNAPIANGIGLALTTANGQEFNDTFTGKGLHAVGPMQGIGAAAQASEYMVEIADVDPTEHFEVAIDGSNDGLLGRTSVIHAGRPLLSSVPERKLLSGLRAG
jgi:hypothetical protein